jgi:hypothetical protein
LQTYAEGGAYPRPSGHYTLSRALAQGGVRFLLTALSLAKREKENKTETSPTIKWEKEDENARKETGKQENKKKRPKINYIKPEPRDVGVTICKIGFARMGFKKSEGCSAPEVVGDSLLRLWNLWNVTMLDLTEMIETMTETGREC